MQQGRSSGGRPSGTAGSDYSYRMVVDSTFHFWCGLILLVGPLLKALPLTRGDDPNVPGLSSVILSFLSLIIGDSGRRRSRSSFLKIYLILSLFAVCLSVAYALKSNIFWKILQHAIANSSEKEIVQLIEAAHISSEVLVLIFAASTTLSLIHNMSPPKR